MLKALNGRNIVSTTERDPERLTCSQLLSKDGPLAQGWAVPAAVAELVLTLVDAQLGTFADDDDGIGAALAEGSLPRGQSGDFVADDVSTQSYHRGECPGRRRGRRSEAMKAGENTATVLLVIPHGSLTTVNPNSAHICLPVSPSSLQQKTWTTTAILGCKTGPCDEWELSTVQPSILWERMLMPCTKELMTPEAARVVSALPCNSFPSALVQSGYGHW